MFKESILKQEYMPKFKAAETFESASAVDSSRKKDKCKCI